MRRREYVKAPGDEQGGSDRGDRSEGDQRAARGLALRGALMHKLLDLAEAGDQFAREVRRSLGGRELLEAGTYVPNPLEVARETWVLAKGLFDERTMDEIQLVIDVSAQE
jgi:hypothetical protein